MIEMVVSVSILAVLTGLVVAGVIGYLSSAYTIRVNETAKTVFYASQNYLLQQKQMGQLGQFSEDAAAYGGTLAWDDSGGSAGLKTILQANMDGFNETDYIDNYTTDTTAYILMEKGSGEGNPLYQIVKSATQDEKLLSNTFLLEYDKSTGVVRSVFYSEQTDSFSYALGAEGSKDNVIKRSPNELLDKKQGYYGVDITGKPINEIVIFDPVNVLLYNGERLYLEWSDSNDENPEFEAQPDLLDSLIYDVTVNRIGADGVTWEPLFSISDIYTENKELNILLDDADDAVNATHGYRLAYKKDKRAYQLILDDIHHSLFDTYTMKAKEAGELPANVEIFEDVRAEDILVCSVTAKLDKATGLTAESLASSSNYQSSAFAGGDDEADLEDGTKADVGGSGIIEDGSKTKPFGIACARQLDNVRRGENITENANFAQTANIDWNKAEGRTLTKAFLPITYEKPFQGIYTADKIGGKYVTLSNLKIQQPEKQMIGLFGINMGEITGVTMVNPVMNGSMYVGTAAGINGGKLTDITVTGGTITGSHLLGGITGYNTAIGDMTNILAECNVTGETLLTSEKIVEDLGIFEAQSKGRYLGGIAGLNKGKGTNLTAGKKSTTKVTGTAYIGGVFGSSDTAANIELKKLYNYNQIVLSSKTTVADMTECYGGITGYQGLGTIEECTNYGIIELKNVAGIKPDVILNIGGIVGLNTGKIIKPSNLGVDSLHYQSEQTKCINEIKKGNMPQYAGKYVGGIAGTNADKAEISGAVNENAVVAGYTVVGGIVGKNIGEVKDSKNAISKKGLVVGTSYLAGGAFGYNASEKTDGFENGNNVFGKGMVGGIMGWNGNLGEDGDETILTYMKDLKFDDSPSYYDALLGIERKLKPQAGGSIESCKNKGFIYAKDCFLGGIAGVNFGTISKSNAESGTDTDFTQLHENGGADCVGGIVGYNGTSGSVDGKIGVSAQNANVELVAGDFTGGIVGVNAGAITGYASVTGNIYAKGDCVGGVIGINTNKQAISQMTINKVKNIKGNFFVGGAIGCNATTQEDKDSILEGIHSEAGKIVGTAYVGGILGYNTYVSAGTELGTLFAANGELTKLKENAFEKPADDGGTASGTVAVFKNCSSSAGVQGDRYVGGIVGYNSNQAKLWILGCNNLGIVELGDASKTKPVIEDGLNVFYYYIGGITGRNSTSGVIHDSVNNGKVKSSSTYLGGICETNGGSVQFCATGSLATPGIDNSVEGDSNSVGGIVGLNEKTGKVVSCKADQYAVIRGGNKTGGLVGTNVSGGEITSNIDGKKAVDVSKVYAAVPSGKDAISVCKGKIWGENNTGGIVGYNQGTVEDSEVTNLAEIHGVNNVGGFVGFNAKNTSSGSAGEVISGLTNYAKVYGKHEVGGIVGKHEGSGIKKCTNSGWVEATGTGLGYAGGITGSTVKQMTVEDCINYGFVTSLNSFAGGIAGVNDGQLKNDNNFGNVAGSNAAVDFSITDNVARGSAIGGITGCNMLNGTILDCASRSRDKDVNGSADNPFWSEQAENKIVGNYMVGGIIGYYVRDKGSLSSFSNTTSLSKEVDITIEPYNNVVNVSGAVEKRCQIGGFIGTYMDAPEPETLENYIFSGTIRINSQAGKNLQVIGGIVANQRIDVTLKNCLFKGKIIGEGNNSDESDYAGIGGLAGSGNGTIIVLPSQDKDGNTIYTSSTPEAFIQGAKRVGGIVGECNSTMNIMLEVAGKAIPIEQVNDSNAPKDFVYYENNATVEGGKSVGGFFGSGNTKSGELIHLKNKGNILSMNSNGKTNLGGIAGNTSASLKYCVNEGQIGAADDASIMNNVGGLVGRWSGTAQATRADNCVNSGIIYAGLNSIGGLFGEASNVKIASSCMNKEDILVNPKGRSAVSGVGGIVGKTSGTVEIAGTADENVMNLPDKNIILKGTTMNAGGIIGIATGTTQVTGIVNKSVIKQADADTYGASMSAVGGIIGQAPAGTTLVLKNCGNTADITFPITERIGGIVGNLSATCTIESCTNDGEINGRRYTGGIVGYAQNATFTAFGQNTNNGGVKGIISIGGLLGYVNNSKGTIKDSTNTAAVVAVTNSLKNTEAQYVGGFVGWAVNGTLELSGLVNKGAVIADYANGINSIIDMGGIAGCVDGAGVSMNRCTNEESATVTVTLPTNAGSANAIGGIAGRVRNSAYIGKLDTADSRTVNRGKVTVSGGRNTVTGAYEIGGIAGIVQEKSTLEHCRNYAEVTGGEANAVDVGGVVGKAYGLIYSCQAENSVKVKGKTNVGGLVGRAADYICKVMSVDDGRTPGSRNYDFSYSAAIVEGSERVGGIIGYQQEATVYNVYVADSAEIILTSTGNADGRTPAYAAGGLIGYAGATDGGYTAKGIVASCYNFGTVRRSDGGNSPYIGGIVGYRQQMAAKDAATGIVDCFTVNLSKVTETIPPKGNLTGTVDAYTWAVGNEPFAVTDQGTGAGETFVDSRDLQTSKDPAAVIPNIKDKFIWTKDVYDALCESLGITPPNPDYTSSAAILEVMSKYDGIKLPHPPMNTVTAGVDLTYGLPFKPISGAFKEYGYRLYLGEIALDTVIDATHKPNLIHSPDTLKLGIGDKMITTSVNIAGLKNYKDLIGKTISVATYALGYKDAGAIDGILNYTKDSDEVVVQQFVVMPPLPQPKVKALEPGENDTDFYDAEGKQVKVRLEIENWSDYLKKPSDIYPNLPDTNLAEPNLYDQFLNGVFQFTMTDGFNATNVSTIGGTKAEYFIKEESKSADISKEPAYYYVDAADNKAYIIVNYENVPAYGNNSNLPWHAFNIKAEINTNHGKITVDPLDTANFKYRYTNSSTSGIQTYRLKSRFLKPKNLKVDYNGNIDPDTDAATPSYALSWEKDGGNAADIKGYEIELLSLTKKWTDADGNEQTTKIVFDKTIPMFTTAPYIQRTDGAAATKLTLTKEALNGIFANSESDLGNTDPTVMWWEDGSTYTLDFQVTTLSRDTSKDLDSKPSDTCAFDLIKRTNEVKDIKAERVDTKLALAWTDDNATGTDKYKVTYELIFNGTSLGAVEKEVTGCRLDGIVIDEAFKDNPFTVKTTVVKLGEQGKTLNSKKTEAEHLIGKRLATPDNLSVSGEKVVTETDGKHLYVNVTWDKGTAGSNLVDITEDSCIGYEIKVILSADGSKDEEMSYTVSGWDTLTTQINFLIDGKKKVQFVVKALGKYPNAGDSDGKSMLLDIPATSLNKPSVSGVTIKSSTETTGSPVDPQLSYTREEWQKADLWEYAISVNPNDVNAAGQHIILRPDPDDLEKTIELDESTYPALIFTGAGEKPGIESAGKEVKAGVYNKSSSLTNLPSEIDESYSFKLPKIKLDTPKVRAISKKEIEDTVSGTKYMAYAAVLSEFGSLTSPGQDTEMEEERNSIDKVVYEVGILTTNPDSTTAFTSISFTVLDENGVPVLDNDGNPIIMEPSDVKEIGKAAMVNDGAAIYFSLDAAAETELLGGSKLAIRVSSKVTADNDRYADSEMSDDTQNSWDVGTIQPFSEDEILAGKPGSDTLDTTVSGGTIPGAPKPEGTIPGGVDLDIIALGGKQIKENTNKTEEKINSSP